MMNMAKKMAPQFASKKMNPKNVQVPINGESEKEEELEKDLSVKEIVLKIISEHEIYLDNLRLFIHNWIRPIYSKKK